VPSVLIVHKSETAVAAFSDTIKRWGYDVIIVTDRSAIQTSVSFKKPDVMILNSLLDEPSGLMLSRQLRRNKVTAGIPSILIALDADEANIAVFQDQTANDCLISPFSNDELRKKVDALLPSKIKDVETKVYEYGGVSFNCNTHRVSRNGRTIHLTPKCYRILRLLIKQPTYVVSREALIQEVWGIDSHVEKRTVDVHIKRLRAALNKSGALNIVRTIRSAGYSLDENVI
jgi:two-component system phosphate regulon response regulator PhoB